MHQRPNAFRPFQLEAVNKATRRIFFYKLESFIFSAESLAQAAQTQSEAYSTLSQALWKCDKEHIHHILASLQSLFGVFAPKKMGYKALSCQRFQTARNLRLKSH